MRLYGRVTACNFSFSLLGLCCPWQYPVTELLFTLPSARFSLFCSIHAKSSIKSCYYAYSRLTLMSLNIFLAWQLFREWQLLKIERHLVCNFAVWSQFVYVHWLMNKCSPSSNVCFDRLLSQLPSWKHACDVWFKCRAWCFESLWEMIKVSKPNPLILIT